MEFPNEIYKSRTKIVKEAGVYWGVVCQNYLFYDGKSDFVETQGGEKIQKEMYGVTGVCLLTESNIEQTTLHFKKTAECFENWKNRLSEFHK